ncbi:hypothetical protein Cme02nite_45150 [Catellatospora methionotrophica]|uniref:Uncharacterized protein n=1 Tax=Catellatospora methionotrophica TaxID=121620 RepID=A0A8J3LDF7_9ACTN|nr:hypothetical protein [Catellatospora methionotrophica]GIG16183.1 hypothetical protein Cme02nite_45150 [Catellatospora methionotrophica]
MDDGQLFVHTLRDLDRRTALSDEYEVLMGAALLRKLLLDQTRVMDRVNRQFKLKLRFRYVGSGPMEELILSRKPVFWAIDDALDPEQGAPFGPVVDATLDQFLARPLMLFQNEMITVRDVIDQLANVEGAVHRSTAREGREKMLQAAGQFYSRNGLSGVVSQVRLIGRITVRGLKPLHDAVIAAGS